MTQPCVSIEALREVRQFYVIRHNDQYDGFVRLVTAEHVISLMVFLDRETAERFAEARNMTDQYFVADVTAIDLCGLANDVIPTGVTQVVFNPPPEQETNRYDVMDIARFVSLFESAGRQ